MPKDTKTLGNSKARACESLAMYKKGCARVLTQPPSSNSEVSIITFAFSPCNRTGVHKSQSPQNR